MCYFDQYRYACGDWKWANFRRHCQAEYRMGETCGMKLILNTIPLEQKCTMCLAIEKKKRRWEKASMDYQRWLPDPARKASAAKAAEEMNELRQEIVRMENERQSRMQNIGNLRRATAQRVMA